MSLFHAKHAKHAKMSEAGESAPLEMVLALMRSRDAISGTEQLVGDPPGPVILPPGDRMMRMHPDHRGAVLLGELSEGLAVTHSTPDDPQTGAPVTATVAHGGGTLVTIDRPGLSQFRAAVPLVGNYAELRADRAAEIEVQTGSLLPFFGSVVMLQPDRCDRITEMLRIALDLTTQVVMRVKLALACPRPTQFSDRMQPIIACPAHPSLPSGHATQAFCLATLLTGVRTPGAPVAATDQLFRLACRIAVNRTVAGVHFPADSAAGAVLGIQLGRWLLARAMPVGAVAAASFDGRRFVDAGDQPRDFHYGVLDLMVTGKDGSTRFGTKADFVAPAPLWSALVAAAQREWDTRWS